jgi:hypothetical protein
MVHTRDWLQSLFRMQAPPTSIFFAESLQATTSHDETMIKQRTRSISCDVVIENPFVPSSGFLTRDRSCISASPVPAQLSEQSVDFRHDLSGAVALQVQSPQTACTSSATRPSGRAGCICTHENPECLGSQLGFTPTAGMMRPLLRYRGIPPRPCRPGEPGYLPIARLADTWCLAQL